VYVSINSNQITLAVISGASLLSLLCLLGKPLAKGFEAVVIRWIQAFKRIRAEWRLPIKNELPVQPPQLLDHIRSKRE